MQLNSTYLSFVGLVRLLTLKFCDTDLAVYKHEKLGQMLYWLIWKDVVSDFDSIAIIPAISPAPESVVCRWKSVLTTLSRRSTRIEAVSQTSQSSCAQHHY